MVTEAKDERFDNKARWTTPKLTRLSAAEAENNVLLGPDLGLLAS